MIDIVERLRALANATAWSDDKALVTEAADAIEQLAGALRGLHDDQADYLRLNHLGGYDNHWMVAARSALARLEKPNG